MSRMSLLEIETYSVEEKKYCSKLDLKSSMIKYYDNLNQTIHRIVVVIMLSDFSKVLKSFEAKKFFLK